MKNHKGSIPALLTLGLVLIGSLVTIGVSYLTNTNKIASNPRAAEKCVSGFYAAMGEVEKSGSGCAPACGGEDKCRECDFNGTKYECINMGELKTCTKARTYASLTNCENDPESTDDSKCTQCLLGSTPRVEYGGTGPPAGGGNPPPVAGQACPYTSADSCGLCKKNECVACNLLNFYCPKDAKMPENCKQITCANKFSSNPKISSGGTNIYISTNITGPPAFYTSPNCVDTTKVSGDALFKYCYSASTGIYPTADNCVTDQNCIDSGLGTAQDTLYDKPYSYFIGNTSDEYHDSSSCGGNIITDLKAYCTTPSQEEIDAIAEEEAKALDKVTCNKDKPCTSLSGVSGITNTTAKASFKYANSKYYYYEDTACGVEILTDITSYCNNQPTLSTPYTVVYDAADEIWNSPSYISCNSTGIKSDSLLKDNFIKNCYEGKTTVESFPNCPFTVIQSDARKNIFEQPTGQLLYCCKTSC